MFGFLFARTVFCMSLFLLILLIFGGGLHLIHINFKFLKAETIKKLFSVIILSLKMTQ